MRLPRIMVLGDSFASGMQDDYTWRRRLARHLERSGTPAEFVGPHRGTFSMYEDPVLLALAEGRTPPTGPEAANPMTGPYREGREGRQGREGPAEDRHCSQPGWTARAAKAVVRKHVAAERPDYLLVQLGFNDLAMVGPPGQTLQDLAAIVAEARAAAPDLTILVAGVAGPAAWGNDWFRATVADFNARLPRAVAAWSTARSPVALVDVHSRFDPEADTYDEVHPNAAGELVMAAAFADALRRFGVGRSRLDPDRIAPRDIPLTRPAITSAHPRPGGALLRWTRVRGASGYRVALRDLTAGHPRTLTPIPVLSDHWHAPGLTPGHVYEIDVSAAHGRRLGPPSEALRVTAGG